MGNGSARRVSGASFDDMLKHLADFQGPAQRRAIGAAAKEVVQIIGESFDRARSPRGRQWRRLASGEARKPLDRTGRLRDSARLARIQGLRFTITPAGYAVFHQDGAPRARIPARSFIPVDPLTKRVAARIDAAMAAAVKNR